MSRMVAGTVLTKRRPAWPKTRQSTKACRRQARSSSSDDAVARRPAEEDDRQLEVRAAGAPREPLPAHGLARAELDDRLEGGPDLAVLDDLQQALPLLALAHPRAHLGASDRVVHEAQDLSLRALQRAPQDEAVAGHESRPLPQVRQGEPAHPGVEEVLDALDELAEVLRAEGRVAPAGPGEEEQEAVALALVAGDEVVLAEALAHVDEEGVDLGAQRAEGRPAERALDVGERAEVDEDGGEEPLIPQLGGDVVLHLAERGDRHLVIVRRRRGLFKEPRARPARPHPAGGSSPLPRGGARGRRPA